MKKLYFIMLCAAVAMTASAQQFAKMQQIDKAKFGISPKKAEKTTRTAVSILDQKETAAMKAAQAKIVGSDEWEEFGTGQMTDFIIYETWGLAQIQDEPAVFEVEIEKSLTTEGLYRIAEPYKNYEIPSELAPYLGYDEELVTPMYIVVEDESFLVLDFMPGFYDADGEYGIVTQLGDNYPDYSVSFIASYYPDGVGTYDNGILTYPATFVYNNKTYYNFMLWIGSESDGYYAANYYGQFRIEFPGAGEEVDPNEGWTSLGNATFIDPWVMPGFGENQYDYPWEVELQQNIEDANIYRLVDPYRAEGCPFADYNSSTAKHGYIQFNVSDPDHVYFYIVDAGFGNTGAGITKLYCYNALGLYVGYYGYEPEDIVEILGDDIPYTTFSDGVITLGYNEELGEYDAAFGIQGNVYAGYIWTSGDMTGSITFPEMNGSAVRSIESSNAPIEYFNVNGQRVSNPAAGQLVIRRQGEKVSKIIAK